MTGSHGRAIRLEGELAFDRSGRFIALRTGYAKDSASDTILAG